MERAIGTQRSMRARREQVTPGEIDERDEVRYALELARDRVSDQVAAITPLQVA